MMLPTMKTLCLLSMLTLSTSVLSATNGKLDPPPNAPRAVSSQVAPDHRAYIAPFVVQGDAKSFFAQLTGVVAKQPRVNIVKQTDLYLKAEFTTAMLRFVDDVEFVLDAKAGVVHVRSASRIGYYDFNTNRNRIEAIRLQMAVQ
ncbi:MAG: DUF1499 domain-containing protein [Moraxellaceae bacterium]|nr:DUF1499 domain-containing protein [Moraxellaceae bacterium]